MPNLVFDFHETPRGKVVQSSPIAYQWDQGHIAEFHVSENASYEVHYGKYNSEETACYTVDSITSEEGGYVVLAHIPNSYFETVGNLNVYLYGTVDGKALTRYEGCIFIKNRAEPDDYVDDDPDNTATHIVEVAQEYAEKSEAWAVGNVNGTPVGSGTEQYHNNSKYYAQQAGSSATSAASSRSDAYSYMNSASESATNAATSERNASESASSASTSETNAASSERNAASSETNALNAANRAEQAAENAGYMAMDIEQGRLIYTRSNTLTTVDFYLSNGNLCMEVF